jgi:hypothetical protein
MNNDDFEKFLNIIGYALKFSAVVLVICIPIILQDHTTRFTNTNGLE